MLQENRPSFQPLPAHNIFLRLLIKYYTVTTVVEHNVETFVDMLIKFYIKNNISNAGGVFTLGGG